MPTRLFDQLDVINIIEGYTLGPTIFHSTGILTNNGFGDFQISGNGSVTGLSGEHCEYTGIYSKSGNIDLAKFPAIPINALITKIQTKLGILLTVAITADATPPNASSSLIGAEVNGGLYGDKSISVSQSQAGPTSASGSQSQAAAFVDAPGGPWTYDQLVASGYVNLTFSIALITSGTGGSVSYASSIDFTARINNFQVEITYTAGPFSWYLQTHTSIIGGKPSIVVDDIVAVDDGTTPPANSVFYGTGENFPTEADIPLYNWYDPVSFTILNQPIRPASGWLLQLVDFIGDSVGDMQLDVALESILVLMTDPSGIYTLVEGQRHDTLYERFVGVPSIDVKIPDPFAKTGFIP